MKTAIVGERRGLYYRRQLLPRFLGRPDRKQRGQWFRRSDEPVTSLDDFSSSGVNEACDFSFVAEHDAMPLYIVGNKVRTVKYGGIAQSCMPKT